MDDLGALEVLSKGLGAGVLGMLGISLSEKFEQSQTVCADSTVTAQVGASTATPTLDA